MNLNGKRWIETPGLGHVLTDAAKEAADILKSETDYRPVLVQGPTGCGKSFIRDWILEKAGFVDGEVLKVNCAAISKSLVESELFGYVRGAFTGAIRDSVGLLGDQSIKIVVMDEIGTLPKYVQAKLLTFFDDGIYRKVGSTETATSQTRIIALTNEDPRRRFREDFLYRFHRVLIPGLHERRGDIPFLLYRFAPEVQWTTEDLLRLVAYHWPGNVRELMDFASRVKRDWPRIKLPGGHMGSVLLWYSGYKPCGNSPTGKGHALGIPDFISIRNLRVVLDRYMPMLGKEMVDFVPNLTLGKELFQKVDLEAFVKDPERNRGLGGGGAGLELEQTPSGSIRRPRSLDLQWEEWCALFSQDPRFNGDVLERVLKGEASGNVATESFYEEDAQEEFERLADGIHSLFYSEGVTVAVSAKKEAPISYANAMSIVQEKLSPQKYKEEWVKRFASRKPADVARQFGLNPKTLAKWFRKSKRKVDHNGSK